MDYYGFDSDVIESLNRLRPSVNRSSGNQETDYSVYRNSTKNNFQFLRSFGHRIPTKCTNSCKRPNHEDSSTSLILKKTSESQIFKQYNSIVNCASLECQEQSPLQQAKQPVHEDKPLIKVTVIPKSDKNTASKLFRKQRIVPKTIQTTSSNHENSIQTKHVYLVVAGRNKDKIYQIKATGSEKFETQLIKDDAIEHSGYFKQFINNLNMERKRKKEKRKDSNINKNNDAQLDLGETKHICKCKSPLQEEGVIEVRPEKSRVRIFGRIGLTEGDRYILNCQATVDDHPVPTSLPTAEKQLSSSSLAAYTKNAQTCQKIGGVACMRGVSKDTREDFRSLRDSIMQTDFQNNAVNEFLINVDKKNRISKESQSTQVNFNNPSNSNKLSSPFRTTELVTRCNCNNTNYPVIETVDSSYVSKNLKSCQSPLVIISVFPKQDNLTDLVQTVQCAQIENKQDPFSKKAANKSEITKKEITNKSRSRSPSPKGVKTRPVKTSSRNESPPRMTFGKKDSTKGTNSPKQALQFFNSNTKKVDTEKKTKSNPPRSPGTKRPPVSHNKREPQFKNTSRQSLKPKAKSPKRKVDMGVNTEHLKTKRVLVDTYTSKIAERMNAYENNLRKNESTISVNIDNENEYFDVSFSQNKLNTDLKVCKTVKEAGAQSFDENEKHDSMDNLFPNMSKKHRRGCVCRSICQNLSDDLINNTPRLTLRDSLEIGHRREDKAMKVTQTHRPDSNTVNTDNMEFLAPIKHFTGDDCVICDPVERDREIRELLGVEERRTHSQFKNLQKQAFGDQISRHCFYMNQCKRTFVTGFSLNNKIQCECVDDTEQSELPPSQNACTLDNCKNIRKNVDVSCPCIADSNTLVQCTIPTCDKYNKKQENDRTKTLTQINTDKVSNRVQDDVDKKLNDENVEKNTVHENIEKKTVHDNVEKNTVYETVENNKANSSNKYEARSELDGTSRYQQLTINRNVQIFLQVEQFTKQKPIMLSKKQYNKIKKTIQHTIGKEKSKRCVCNRSVVCVGQNSVNTSQFVHISSNKEVQTNSKEVEVIKEFKKYGKSKKWSKKEKELVETLVLFSNETRGSLKNKKLDRRVVKRAASSKEIRDASVTYWKHLTFSSTNVGSIGSSSFAKRNQHSIETIFRGHKKSLTPNLGTSAFSLLSETHISKSQSLKPCSPGAKAKKPFLRRLMSCLVMKSARASEKIPSPVSYPPSENSSVDEYHISTSFGAIEMSSSIYDTSASFYSDHSIHPLSSKLKRSFFTSVRGFLTSRKS